MSTAKKNILQHIIRVFIMSIMLFFLMFINILNKVYREKDPKITIKMTSENLSKHLVHLFQTCFVF